MNPIPSPLSDIVRVHQIGAGLSRTLTPDADVRGRIARELDLASLDAFEATLELTPHETGWRLSGCIRADAVQSCGLTLEPLPVVIDQTFVLDLAEGVEDSPEVEVSIDDAAPDLIEDGKIDLGQYAIEQLALSLDPFPRKPGAEFVQPAEPNEINPFAVLKQFKAKDDEG
jgi:uncharacterized metal-binding protein YceD (DUF177 family)